MRFSDFARMWPARPFLGRRLTAILSAGIILTAAASGFGQDNDARFAGWSKVESATETRTYREAMKGGGAFDAAARGFLEEIALPQLALEANRSTIEKIRKRMREYLLTDISNEKAAEDASKTAMAFMESLAGKDDVDPVVRVNAMLLIGELQSMDRKPWQPAAAVLAGAVANAELPKAVRIAACVGLARHVEATKGVAEEQQRMAAVAGPAIMAVLKEPAKDPMPPTVAVENDWMASRCLSMLPLLGPLSPATAAEVVRILDEGSRSINVRVRAAAALAASAGPESKIDKASVIKSIGALAVSALERDVAAADKILLDRQYGGSAGQSPPGMMAPGMMPPGMMAPGMMAPGMMAPGMMAPGMMPPGMAVDPTGQPVAEQLIPRESCRRAAWRLWVLAEAVLTDDSKRGLAVLGGDASPAAVDLAQSLRRAAMDLDATPEETTLRQALADLKPAAPAAPAAGEAQAAEEAPVAAPEKPAPAAATK
jgi:hypothetical protein